MFTYSRNIQNEGYFDGLPQTTQKLVRKFKDLLKLAETKIEDASKKGYIAVFLPISDNDAEIKRQLQIFLQNLGYVVDVKYDFKIHIMWVR